MKKLRRVIAIGGLVLPLMLASGGDTFAKITERCTNPCGQEPQGQCQGQALERERVNPAGHAPPGQNP
jgi:hypothetical protein